MTDHLMGQYVGDERRRAPRERTLSREELMGGGSGKDGGDGQTKVLWAVITALAITAMTGWYQASQKATVDLAVLQATVARDSKDTDKRLDAVETQLRVLTEAINTLHDDKVAAKGKARR